MKYPEINRFGLTEYHKQKLCYPYTDVPAFKFWEPPTGEVYPVGVCPMRAWQDGRCGLCGFRDGLVEDHCHDSGLIRGMLCKSCNITEGVGDGHNIGPWREGVTVAAELGIREKYVDIFGKTPMRPKPLSGDVLDAIADAMASDDDEDDAREAGKRKIASAVMW